MRTGVAAALVTLGLLPAAGHAEYTVVVDLAQPDELTATLKLPKAEGAPHRLDVRGAAWGLHPQAHSATCGGVPLKQQKNETWIADVSCREVTWKISPVVALDGYVDVSKQATLLFQKPRWLLLAESTSLLRLVDDTTGSASSITIRSGNAAALGATPAGKQSWRVPSATSSPEFFVVGDVPARSRTVGAFEVRHVADDWVRVEALGLEALHEKALAYLARVIPPPAGLAASERTLLVVWIAIDERRGLTGGAAGNRSVVANYVAGKAAAPRQDAARAVSVVAQAQFRQLAEMARGSRSALPSRVYDGLAAHYALKALAQAGVPAGAESVRAQFSKAGAAFWSAVDDALRAQSSGTTDLDALIPQLLSQDIAPGDRLPTAFVAMLGTMLGTRFDPILAKYD